MSQYQFEYRGRLYDYYWVYRGVEKVANWVEGYFDHRNKTWVKPHLHVVEVRA